METANIVSIGLAVILLLFLIALVASGTGPIVLLRGERGLQGPAGATLNDLLDGVSDDDKKSVQDKLSAMVFSNINDDNAKAIRDKLAITPKYIVDNLEDAEINTLKEKINKP